MSDRPTSRPTRPEPPAAAPNCPESNVAATWSSTGSSLPHSYESSFGPSGLRFLSSASPFVDSGYDSVDSPHVLNLLATERDEELGTMFAMSIEDLPGNCDEDGPDSASTPLRHRAATSPGLPMFHASPPPGTFRPLHPALEPHGARQSPQSVARREWRTVSTQTPPGVSRTRSARARPRSAPLYEEREDSSSEKDEEDDENVFLQNAPQAPGADQMDGAVAPAPLPDLLPERRPRSASVPALSRIYEQQVGEQLRELGDSIFQERFAPRSLPNRRPFLRPSSMRRASLSDSLWDLVNRLVNL